MAIPKKLRLNKRSDFKLLIDTGNNKHLSFARVKISKVPNKLNQPRFAVIVAKTIDSKATARNKARRKITSAILEIIKKSPISAYDYIFFTNPVVKTISRETVLSEINSIFIK